MIYLSNAFSIQMLKEQKNTLSINEVSVEEAKDLLSSGFKSAIGHQDLANVVGNMLNLTVEANRISINLNKADILVVAQYSGKRLPEGTTTLPEDATIKFFRVKVVEN